MTRTILVGLGGLAVLTILGLAVLAPLRRPRRDALLTAAPLLGAALLAVVMSTTAWFLPAGGGLAVTAAVALALVVVALARGTRPWRVDPRALGTVAMLLAVGGAAAATALLPHVWVGDGRAISANGSHDLYYYAAESTWLLENPIGTWPDVGDVPGAGTSTPADYPMYAALRTPLRIGQPMVQAALLAATGRSAVEGIGVLTAVWVLIAAPGAYAAARLLRVRPRPALAVAVVCGTSGLLVQQAYQQNVDSLLGVGLAVLALAACVAAVERRVPVPLAALVLAAVVAVYTEYATFLAPAVLAGVLLRRPLRRAVLARAGALVALAVVMAPTAWARGVGVLLVDRSADDGFSPLADEGFWPAAARMVGAMPLTGTAASRAAIGFLALLVLGWVGAVLADRYRAMWAVLLVVGLGYVAWLTLEGRGYTQMRAAVLLAPLLLLASGVGWAAVLERLRGRVRARPGPGAPDPGRAALAWRAAAAGLAASAAVFAVVNLRYAPLGLDRSEVAFRHVDSTFDEIAAWVAADGGPRGEDVTAIVPDLFTQVWTAGALRGADLVAYPALRPDYLGRTSHWAGEADRYWLVGPGAQLDADDGALVATNARFAWVDTAGGRAVAATPQDAAHWFHRVDADGGLAGPDLGRVLVLRSPDASTTPALVLAAPGATDDVAVLVTVLDTGEQVRAVVDADGEPVPVPVGAARTAVVEIDLEADGRDSGLTLTLRGVLDAD